MNEYVSVIVPVYNVENYLEQCVNSLIHQSYKYLEIILIDDGATDSSGLLADKLATTDMRIKVIHQQNGGLSAARNTGLDNCNGDYICFVDSDDYVKDDFVEELLNACKTNNASMAMCFYYKVKDGIEIFRHPQKDLEIISPKQACMRYLDPSYEVTWNKIYKRELFDGIRFPVGRIHEDVATTYKCFWKSNCVAVIHKELYGYRVNSSGIMGSKYSARKYDEIRAVKEGVEFFEQKGENDVYKSFILLFLTRTVSHLNQALMDEILKGEYYEQLQKDAIEMLQIYKEKFGSSAEVRKLKFGIFHPNLYFKLYDITKRLKGFVKTILRRKMNILLVF